MQAEFSAFSYGSALSWELGDVRDLGIAAMPLLPTAPEQGRLGDDTSFRGAGSLVFVHFKAVEYMLTPRAKGWTAHEERFFRLTVPPRSHSPLHRLLRRLCEAEADVYYAAPAFYRQREFARGYALGQIIPESVFIPLRLLPDLSDDAPHYLTYRHDLPGFRWHAGDSEYFDVPVTGSDWLVRLRQLAQTSRQLGWRSLLKLRQNLVACIEQTTTQPRLFDELAVSLDDVTPLAVLHDLRHLLLTHFQLQAFVVRPA
jgi:hypothetical protein